MKKLCQSNLFLRKWKKNLPIPGCFYGTWAYKKLDAAERGEKNKGLHLPSGGSPP
jgi:hypothetical protein